MVGLQVSCRRGPTLRLSLRQRQAILGKGRASHATKKPMKSLAGTHVSPVLGYGLEYGEQYNVTPINSSSRESSWIGAQELLDGGLLDGGSRVPGS